MAINLTEKFTEHVDEMFTTESKKALVTNRDYNWTGAHTIKVHKVNTVGMNDYDRLGTGENSSRYGALGSVENTLEEFTLRKDRSFTFAIDKLDKDETGTAFGTGMHETTQLCIRQIRKYVTENTKILDVGCGSGILGMLALKFGAKYSVGTDLDPCAIDATHENMEVNGISKDRYEVMIGNIIDDKEVQDKVGYECYDIVAANILADVLVALTPVVVNQIKKGGIYITSGIIDDKEETVVEAVKKAGLEVLDITYQGEWVCVTARKN